MKDSFSLSIYLVLLSFLLLYLRCLNLRLEKELVERRAFLRKEFLDSMPLSLRDEITKAFDENAQKATRKRRFWF